MDSGAAATIRISITLTNCAGVGEDGTELARRVAEAIVVIGVGACIQYTPVMVASLPRKTNYKRATAKQ